MLQTIVFETVFLALIFFVGLGLSRVLVPFSRKGAVVLGVVDRPDERKVHARAVPRLGGLAMAVALLLTVLLSVRFDNNVVPAFLLGAGLVVLTGLIDDTRGLSARAKFLGQVVAAAVFIAVSGVSLVSFGNILGFGEIRTGWLGPVLTVFCMVGVMNALNLSDGLDGLAGGISFIAALMLAAVAYNHQAWFWSVLSLSLLGVLLGFLRHNHYPASLFMGDAGSLLLGFSLAAIAVGLAQPGGTYVPVAPVKLGTVLALPIIDTLCVMGRRVMAGYNPFVPDKTHLHHRLLNLGLSHAAVVSIMYLLMLGCAMLAWYGRHWPEWRQFYTVIAVFALFYAGLYLLERRGAVAGVSFERMRGEGGRAWSGVLEAWQVRLRTMAMVLVCLVLVIPLAGVLPVPRVLGLMLVLGGMFVLLLFPWRGKVERIPLGHGVLYVASVILLIVYLFTPNRPLWVMSLVYGAAGTALVWVVAWAATSWSLKILYPSGFKILMLFFSWSFPLVILPMLGVNSDMVLGVAAACLLALPLVAFWKVVTTDAVRPDRSVAAGVILVFLVVGGTAFL